MRDAYPRGWGAKEATYASTAAMWWRYRVDVEGYERVIHMARNSHVVRERSDTNPPDTTPPTRTRLTRNPPDSPTAREPKLSARRLRGPL